MTLITRAALLAQANTDLPDNVLQEISPEDVRTMSKNIIDSMVSKYGDTGILGLLQYSNTFTLTDGKELTHKKYVDDLIDAVILGGWDLAGDTLGAGTFKLGSLDNFDFKIIRNNVDQIVFGASAINIKNDTIITGSGNTSATFGTTWKDSSGATIAWLDNDGTFFTPKIANSVGTTIADFDNHKLLYAGDTSIEWDTRLLKDAGTYYSLNWNARVLGDALGVLAMNWASRTLNDQNGNAALYWEEDGIGIGGNDFGGGTYCMYMRNAYVIPPTAPASGIILYPSAGTLSMLASSGERALIAGTYQSKSATYTALPTDATIECTSGTFTVTLYTAVGYKGRDLVINNQGTGVVTVDGDGTETINGALTQTLNQYDSLTIRSNGSNWIII